MNATVHGSRHSNGLSSSCIAFDVGYRCTIVHTNNCYTNILSRQGSAHGGQRWAAAPSTRIRRPPQQLEKNGKLSILSTKTWLYYKNGVFDAKTAHQYLARTLHVEHNTENSVAKCTATPDILFISRCHYHVA